jgi:hypothetical protein
MKKLCDFKKCQDFKSCPKAMTKNQGESYLKRLSESGHTKMEDLFYTFPPSCYRAPDREDGLRQPDMEFD